MKFLKCLIIFSTILGSCLACHKSGGVAVSPVSLTVINAIAESNWITPIIGTNDSIEYFNNAASISYMGSLEYSPISGPTTMYIVQGNDTTNLKLRTYTGSLNLAPGGIYSFFVAGDTIQADTLFVQDHIPHYTDSSSGVRFVNLSPGSQPISINIAGNAPMQTEFSNLAYKSISPWNKYPANGAVGGSYTFEVRNQANDSLLYTYSWNYTIFKNSTIVISGSEDPTSPYPVQVFQYNNY